MRLRYVSRDTAFRFNQLIEMKDLMLYAVNGHIGKFSTIIPQLLFLQFIPIGEFFHLHSSEKEWNLQQAKRDTFNFPHTAVQLKENLIDIF